ncbi:hypothetical protein [Helicobacter pylori]|uniref:hypothetical protein n=1 Tax=Helicobacter pylori TaxID=210 RepID=UPI001ABA921C|nr:hypothetical protein [Helicobacter pylori]
MKFDELLAKILVLVGGYRFDFILLKEALKSFYFVLLIMKFKKSKKHFCNQNIKELSQATISKRQK